MDIEKIRKIEQQTIERYSDRFVRMQESPKTLGWGNKEQQIYRFDRLLDCVDCENRIVLDIGCGFGDLLEHINYSKIHIRQYIGIDINPDFIGIASRKFPSQKFILNSPFNLDNRDIYGDITIMLGLLNFKQVALDNWLYAKQMLAKAFELTREVLVVDFLSSYSVPDYPTEDFVFYYDPRLALSLALEITPYVSMIHDYLPIPQQEFMLILRKEGCKF